METFIPRGRVSGPILPRFVLERKMSAGARILYALLCEYAGDHDRCWPTQKTLAGRLTCGITSVKEYIRELMRERLVAVSRQERGCVYILLNPRQGGAGNSCFRARGESVVSPHVAGSPSSANFRSAGDSSRRARIQPDSGYESDSGYVTRSESGSRQKRNNIYNKNIYNTTPPFPPVEVETGPISSSRAGGCRLLSSRPSRGGGGGDFFRANSAFETLYAAYPRKEAKELARAAWHRLWRRGVLPALDVLLQTLGRFKESQSWQRERGRFVPQLVNWLKGQRWQDEMPAPSSQTPVPGADPRQEEIRRRFEEEERRREASARADATLPAPAREAFERFLARFAGGEKFRGPAFGLWSQLLRRGNAPGAADVGERGTDVLTFLRQWKLQPGGV